MSTLRRTKIIATLGPATDKDGVLENIIKAGVDIVRLNFSHGTTDDHIRRIKAIRKCAELQNIEVAILADLQGPKIRIAKFRENKIQLKEGEKFTLDASLADNAGDINHVGIDYKALPNDVKPNDKLLLDDGRLVLSVTEVSGSAIQCTVEVGGELSNNKGINRSGGGLSADALTEKDREDLKIAVQMEVDYVAISFPRSADDINQAKKLIAAANGSAGIIAKIERTEAVKNIESIIEASDAVMVARGDLGVEIGDAELPRAQKMIIQRARELDKAVITATQMMESMIVNAIPTRAEVFDVANAVLDGTDAVMLSAETAAGKHPDKVVAAMARICLGAEKQVRAKVSGHRVECRFQRVDEAIAMATMYTANHLNISGILALTESGSTPLWMSRIHSGLPIFALCRSPGVRRKMKLFRGVYPVAFDVTTVNPHEINRRAVAFVEEQRLVSSGDLVILTKGDLMGVVGGANAMKILEVGSVV